MHKITLTTVCSGLVLCECDAELKRKPGNVILDFTNYWNQCSNLLVETFSCFTVYLRIVLCSTSFVVLQHV